LFLLVSSMFNSYPSHFIHLDLTVHIFRQESLSQPTRYADRLGCVVRHVP
jgi:hypothetical protein